MFSASRADLPVEIGKLRPHRADTRMIVKQGGGQVGDIGPELHLALPAGAG